MQFLKNFCTGSANSFNSLLGKQWKKLKKKKGPKRSKWSKKVQKGKKGPKRSKKVKKGKKAPKRYKKVKKLQKGPKRSRIFFSKTHLICTRIDSATFFHVFPILTEGGGLQKGQKTTYKKV